MMFRRVSATIREWPISDPSLLRQLDNELRMTWRKSTVAYRDGPNAA
jgi:hypothetical protein